MKVILLFLLLLSPIYSEEASKIDGSFTIGFSTPNFMRFSGERDDYDSRVRRNLFYYYVHTNTDVLETGKAINAYNYSATENRGKFDNQQNMTISAEYRIRPEMEIGFTFLGESSFQPYSSTRKPLELLIYKAASQNSALEIAQILNLSTKEGRINFGHKKFHFAYINRYEIFENYYKLSLGYNEVTKSYDTEKGTQSLHFTYAPSIGCSIGLNVPKYYLFLEASATKYFVPANYKELRFENVFKTNYWEVYEYSITAGYRYFMHSK